MKISIKTLKETLNQSLFNANYKTYLNPLYESIRPGKSLVESTGLVLAKEMLGNDIVSITIEPDNKWKGFEPGQHILLGFIINGKRYNRAFSICSNQVDFKKNKCIKLAIQKQKNGIVTNYIHNILNVNDRIYISQAQGDFTISEENNKHLFIAGGLGVTPIMSMLLTYASSKNLVLLYYAKSGHHINKSELKKLEKTNTNIKIKLLSSEEHGRINKRHIQEYCGDIKQRQIYICGPEGFIEKTNAILDSEKILEKQIKREFFSITIQKTNVKSVNIKLKSQPSDSIQINTDKTILESLEEKNINIKHGCRMGICNQCLCEKEYGQVYNIVTKEVSDNRKSNIQPCISVPVGDIKLNI